MILDVGKEALAPTMAAYEAARKRARELGLDDMELTWTELYNLRNHGDIGIY